MSPPAIVPDEIDDSTYGDDSGSELAYTSLSSSIYQYRLENGRTYHAYSDGKYLVPNDEQEQDRMDLVYHSLLKLFDGKAFFSPVENPQRIVDMGTGTGIWALDVGDEFPEAHVTGIDLSPIQPRWVSPNVDFRIDDFEKPWVFETPLDLVNARICKGVAIKQWSFYLSEALRCLKPGGYVEIQDFDLKALSDDDSFPKDSVIVKWHNLLQEGVLKAGGNMQETSQDIKGYMEKAGFVNVKVLDFKWPMSPWPADSRLKEVGALSMVSMLEGIQGISLAPFMRILGWNRIELELFLTEVRKEWKQKNIHGYWPAYSVYGQKPVETN